MNDEMLLMLATPLVLQGGFIISCVKTSTKATVGNTGNGHSSLGITSPAAIKLFLGCLMCQRQAAWTLMYVLIK